MISDHQEEKDDSEYQDALVHAEHDEHPYGYPEQNEPDQALHEVPPETEYYYIICGIVKKSFLFA